MNITRIYLMKTKSVFALLVLNFGKNPLMPLISMGLVVGLAKRSYDLKLYRASRSFYEYHKNLFNENQIFFRIIGVKFWQKSSHAVDFHDKNKEKLRCRCKHLFSLYPCLSTSITPSINSKEFTNFSKCTVSLTIKAICPSKIPSLTPIERL